MQNTTTDARYVWLNEASRSFLERDYLLPGQTVDDRVRVVCDRAEQILGIAGYADRLRHCLERGWLSLSTPIWTNFGSARGLPISCYGVWIDDSMASILEAHAEVGMQTKYGGGTSAYFGELRGRGRPITGNGLSSGSVHFAKLFDTLVTTISQGSTRRGNFTGYWPIDHPDVHEVLGIRTEGHPVQDISFGVCVSDEWMQSMIQGDRCRREVWAKVLERRRDVGFPYVFFVDAANRGAPDVYRDKGLRITHSNLCSEIALPDGPDESFVCDLLSMNALYYPEWKNAGAVEVAILLLDAVMTEFIQKAESIPFLGRAVRFARRHRALGLGLLGWHSLLQSQMIPFESMRAKTLNVDVARTIQTQAHEASHLLARDYGEPELLRGYGRRNATLTAIAPTKSSSFILGQASEGIEPHRSNYYVKDLAKGKYTVKNPHLEEFLDARGKNTADVWKRVLEDSGSVRKLDFLSDEEKAVFATFWEIAPREVVIQAAARQKYVDQGQSLNLMIPPRTPTKDVNALHVEAWRLGLKSLYYQIGQNAAQEFTRSILSCSSCEA